MLGAYRRSNLFTSIVQCTNDLSNDSRSHQLPEAYWALRSTTKWTIVHVIVPLKLLSYNVFQLFWILLGTTSYLVKKEKNSQLFVRWTGLPRRLTEWTPLRACDFPIRLPIGRHGSGGHFWRVYNNVVEPAIATPYTNMRGALIFLCLTLWATAEARPQTADDAHFEGQKARYLMNITNELAYCYFGGQ